VVDVVNFYPSWALCDFSVHFYVVGFAIYPDSSSGVKSASHFAGSPVKLIQVIEKVAIDDSDLSFGELNCSGARVCDLGFSDNQHY